MAIQPTPIPPRYLCTKEAARFVSLSPRTLEKHRCYGTGPEYHKIGGRVIYSVEALQDWVGRGAKISTADTRRTILPARPPATMPALRRRQLRD